MQNLSIKVSLSALRLQHYTLNAELNP